MTTTTLVDYGITWYHPKLGDALVHQSAFEHWADVQWLMTEDVPTVLPSVWKQTNKMWEGRYNLELVTGKPKQYNKNFMMECAKQGITMRRPSFQSMGRLVTEPYVTCQLNSSHPTGARDISLDEVREHAQGLHVVNLDNIKRDNKSLTRMFTLLEGAEFHVGPDSGCAWASVCVGTPTTILRTDSKKLTPKELMMHECAMALIGLNDGVTIV